MVTKVSINGRFYDQTAKETAKELGIEYTTLMSRIRSSSETYKDWVISDLSVDIVINGKNYADIDTALLALLDLKHRIKKIKAINNSKN